MMNEKPHLGKIRNWHRVECEGGLGYQIVGKFDGHPHFHNQHGYTSYVVLHDPNTHEIETRNSRYTLSTNHN